MSKLLTDRQLDLMEILWDRGSATVREAQDTLDEDLAYTSVLTVFQTLEGNGDVSHEPDGKAYRYFPEVSRGEAARQFRDHLAEHGLLDELMIQSAVDRKEARM